jgi:hypothetical protein
MRYQTLVRKAALVIAVSALGACGDDSTEEPTAEGWTPPAIPANPNITQATKAIPVDLRFDRLLYASSSSARLTLTLPEGATTAATMSVAVASPDSKDAEMLTLERTANGIYVTAAALPIDDTAPVKAQDGTLRVAPGELIYAMFVVDPTMPGLEDAGAGLVADFAIIQSSPLTVSDLLLPEIALTDDENVSLPGARPVGTLLREGALPVQVATSEVILHAKSQSDLERFLEVSGGELIDTLPGDDDVYATHLVKVDPSQAKPESLGQLRALFGESDELFASNEQALQVLALVMEYRLDGHLVSLNPRLQTAGAPSISTTETNAVTHTMKMVGARTVTGPCIPGDPARLCVENVPAVWAFNALWDGDDERINVAVLDMGFAANDDFRRPASGTFVECDMTTIYPAYRCEAGAAQGPPTVGNSFFGGRSWHGTGVITTLGGVVNNGVGAAGVGGQVAVPMMYKYDTLAYAFDIGRGVRKAVDDGASCINVSGGYPCNILTVGPDFNICTMGGRLELCAVIHAGLAVAAGVTCATLGWIPFVGQAICGAAVAGAVAATTTCVATLAFGDLRGPMETGIKYAATRGVPVVTIAGNTLTASAMPPIVRDLVDLSERRTEAWGIMPAMIPETIVAGAVHGSLDNAHFYGDRVDVWAPIPTTYFAPSNVNDMASSLAPGEIGGTSAAAPFVTGVISVVMAVNPDLNPRNPLLNNSQRSTIVSRIRGILTSDDTTFSNGDLVAAGYSSQPVERRKLIDPLAAVRLAAAGKIPDTAALGYDPSLGFSEVLGADDTEATATVIPIGATRTGTILTIPEASGTSSNVDVDFFRFTMPASPNRPHEATITLTYPKNFGELYVQAPNMMAWSTGSSGDESTRQFRVMAEAGANVAFSVRAASGDDNVYKVSVATPQPAVAQVMILEPTDGVQVCALEPVPARAVASFPGFSTMTVPDSAFAWFDGATSLGTGPLQTLSLSAGSHTIKASVHDAFDEITVLSQPCTNDPPVAFIDSPAGDLVQGDALFYTGYDDTKMMWFTDVELAGHATDTEDGALPGSQLVWRTNLTSVQDSLLGTGSTLTARLYSNVCTGVMHTISLQATDSSGNPSPTVTRRIVIYTIC